LASVENFPENKKPLIQLVNDLDFDQQNYFKMQEANPLELKVFVYDHEDEYNTVAQTQWASNLQGALTNGLRFNTKNLTAGKHNITVTAQDSKGATRSIKFNIIDRKNANYFTVIVMTEDEKRFYDFLKKFCEEHEISFIDPRTQFQEEVRALYKRIDELKILIEESELQEKK
jgi:hypothetical protein